MPFSPISLIHLKSLKLVKRRKGFVIWNEIKTTREHVLNVNIGQKVQNRPAYHTEMIRNLRRRNVIDVCRVTEGLLIENL